MDFIERIFGVSPDGGSGLLEWAIVLLPIVVIGCVVVLRNKSGGRRV